MIPTRWHAALLYLSCKHSSHIGLDDDDGSSLPDELQTEPPATVAVLYGQTGNAYPVVLCREKTL